MRQAKEEKKHFLSPTCLSLGQEVIQYLLRYRQDLLRQLGDEVLSELLEGVAAETGQRFRDGRAQADGAGLERVFQVYFTFLWTRFTTCLVHFGMAMCLS